MQQPSGHPRVRGDPANTFISNFRINHKIRRYKFRFCLDAGQAWHDVSFGPWFNNYALFHSIFCRVLGKLGDRTHIFFLGPRVRGDDHSVAVTGSIIRLAIGDLCWLGPRVRGDDPLVAGTGGIIRLAIGDLCIIKKT